jgi:hypothetical protein
MHHELYVSYNNKLNVLFILRLLIYHTAHILGVSTAHHQEVECIYLLVILPS